MESMAYTFKTPLKSILRCLGLYKYALKAKEFFAPKRRRYQRIKMFTVTVNGQVADYVQQAASLTVVSTNTMGSAAKLTKRKHGIFLMPHSWSSDGRT